MTIDANTINLIISFLSGIIVPIAFLLISPQIIAKPLYLFLQKRLGINKAHEIGVWIIKLGEELKKLDFFGDTNLVSNAQIDQKTNEILDNLKIEPDIKKDSIGIKFTSKF